MRVIYLPNLYKGVWKAEGTYDELNQLAKPADFKWHSAGCSGYVREKGEDGVWRDNLSKPCWFCDNGYLAYGTGRFTHEKANAKKLVKYMTPEAKEALGTYAEDAEESRAISLTPAEEKALAVPAPPGIKFLPYQLAGIRYAVNPTRRALIIGDGTGLGKTPQAIGSANKLGARRVLIVCPKAVKKNWLREMQKFSTIEHKYHIQNDSGPIPDDATCVIVNYEKLRVSEGAGKPMKGDKGGYVSYFVPWDLVICDEFHTVMQHNTGAARGLIGQWDKKNNKAIDGILNKPDVKKVIFLSATPIKGYPEELYKILRFMRPDIWRSKIGFIKKYTMAKEQWGYNNSFVAEEKRQLDLRKVNILRDDIRAYVMVARPSTLLEQLGETPPMHRKGIIVDIDPETTGKKKYVVTNSFNSAIPRRDFFMTLKNTTEGFKVSFVDTAAERLRVGLAKVPVVVDTADTLLKEMLLWEEPTKLILFVWHHEVADEIQRGIEGLGYTTEVITGDNSSKVDATVNRFNDKESGLQVLILSIGVGGVGLNIHKACNTILIGELDWNASTFDQVEGRIKRVGTGASRLRTVYTILNNSMDARIAELMAEKADSSEMILHDETPELPEVPEVPVTLEEAQETVTSNKIGNVRLSEDGKYSVKKKNWQAGTSEEIGVTLDTEQITALHRMGDSVDWTGKDLDFGSRIQRTPLSDLLEWQVDRLYASLPRYHAQLEKADFELVYGEGSMDRMVGKVRLSKEGKYAVKKKDWAAGTSEEIGVTLDKEQIQALYRMGQNLAEMCDGAMMRDVAGFNKSDTDFGRALAKVPLENLLEWHVDRLYKTCKKYHRQLDAADYELVYGQGPVPTSKPRKTKKVLGSPEAFFKYLVNLCRYEGNEARVRWLRDNREWCIDQLSKRDSRRSNPDIFSVVSAGASLLGALVA